MITHYLVRYCALFTEVPLLITTSKDFAEEFARDVTSHYVGCDVPDGGHNEHVQASLNVLGIDTRAFMGVQILEFQDGVLVKNSSFHKPLD